MNTFRHPRFGRRVRREQREQRADAPARRPAAATPMGALASGRARAAMDPMAGDPTARGTMGCGRWLLVLALGALCGCGGPAPAPTTTAPAPSAVHRSQTPDAGEVNGRDADAVSRTTLTVMAGADTRTDTGFHEASLRAGRFLTPGYLAELRAVRPQAGPGAQWESWRAHRAYIRPQLRPGGDERPADTATEAVRQWRVDLHPVGRDGWRGEPLMWIAFVSLARTGPEAGWKVSAVVLR
ncbi:hypothetical protein ACWDRB_47530 [Nonomuraea sp. NPDC003707]